MATEKDKKTALGLLKKQAQTIRDLSRTGRTCRTVGWGVITGGIGGGIMLVG